MIRSVAKYPTGSCLTHARQVTEQQTQAILQAIQGDTMPLTRIRASRNIPTPLPNRRECHLYHSPALRLYTPAKKNQSPLPLLIYLHGRRMDIRSINSCARFCQTLAATGNVIVLTMNLSSGSRTSVSGRTGGLYTCRKLAHQSFGMGQLTGALISKSEETVQEATSLVRLSA